MFKRIAIFVFSFFFASVVFADFTPEVYVDHPDRFFHQKNWFAGGSVGVTTGSVSYGSITVPSGQAGYPDLYSINSPSAGGLFSLYGGYRLGTTSRPYLNNISVALRYQYLGGSTISGTIDQYSLPDYVNYNYSIDVSSNVISLFAKCDVYQFDQFAPYISVGFGEAFNIVNNYSEQALSGVTSRNSPAYGASHNFTYNAGLGLDYNLNRRLLVSLGYEYDNFGNIKSGNGVSTWSSDSLSFGTLTSNMVLFSMFYTFRSY